MAQLIRCQAEVGTERKPAKCNIPIRWRPGFGWRHDPNIEDCIAHWRGKDVEETRQGHALQLQHFPHRSVPPDEVPDYWEDIEQIRRPKDYELATEGRFIDRKVSGRAYE
jgi:hypothetical protein